MVHYRGVAPRMPARRILPWILAFLALLAGCTSHRTRPSPSEAGHRIPPLVIVDVAASDPGRANSVLIRAIGLVGVPYRRGGNTPDTGFDCSGLVGFVFRDMGNLALPRTARDIAALPVPRIRDNRLAPADLVFFGDAHVNHVGIYVGQGRFVHAPNVGGTVRLDEINGYYWREHYLGARRVLR
ncbi:MAG TPA: C40 family peptidase [Xanthomonadaceae bacterium]|jgi:cell wall-associated NlpC family hydrolase|nr:C40 family peptidase [Xanthomonadaceae bacterium]